MKERYFNSDGREVLLGLGIASRNDAAYIAKDPNDPILTRAPAGMKWVIENGSPSLVSVVSEASLLNTYLNEQYNRYSITGMKVKGTFYENGIKYVGITKSINMGSDTLLRLDSLRAAAESVDLPDTMFPRIVSLGGVTQLLVEDFSALKKILSVMHSHAVELDKKRIASFDVIQELKAGFIKSSEAQGRIRSIWSPVTSTVTL